MVTFSALLAFCAGNSPVTGEFPTQRPVTRSFDVFFDLCLNKRLCKQSWGLWFETPSRSLWRQRNDHVWIRRGFAKPPFGVMTWVSNCIQYFDFGRNYCPTPLAHWGRDKMAVVSQTTLSNAFSWMKMLEFRLRFHWSLFLRVQLTIIQH